MEKILVIEDDNTLQQVIVVSLTNEGFEVITAKDGEEGLAKAQSEKPDLITLDLIMPGLYGIDVLKKLKADETTKNIPVVVLTIKDDADSISECISAGARSYITKTDYTLKKVINEIKTVLTKTR